MLVKMLRYAALVFGLAIALTFVVHAWTDPSQAPPNGNVPPPGGGGGGAPGGLDTQVQFNNAGAFGGDANLIWNNTAKSLGIGTAPGAYRLDVSGDANATRLCIAGVCQATWPAGGGGFWTQTGFLLYPNNTAWNVGIGTASPGETLEVSGRIKTGNIRISGAEEVISQGIRVTDVAPGIAISGNPLRLNWDAPAAAPIIFASNATEWMRILGTGSVGIGTPTPGQKLDVAGGYIRSDTGFCIGASCITSWPGSTWRVLNKATTQTNSTTTGADISDLTVPLAASETIHFHAYLVTSAASTGTAVQLAVNGPGTPSEVSVTYAPWTSTTAVTVGAATAYESYSTNLSSQGAVHRVYEIYGRVVNGVTAGTFALRFRSEISANAVTVYPGSWLQYFK